MFPLVEDGSVYGCRRFIALSVVVVALCLILDSAYVRRQLATTVAPWLRQCQAQIKRYVASKCCHLAARLCEDLDAKEAAQIMTPIAVSRPVSPPASPSPPSTPLALAGSNAVGDTALPLQSPQPQLHKSLQESRLTKRSDSAVSISNTDGLVCNNFTAPAPKHTLYICTKCTRKADDRDLESCRLATGTTGGAIADMEDLVPPPKPRTGQLLYQTVIQRNNMPDLVIQPVSCLSACSRGNVVAMAGGGKYTYQFGDVDERDEEQVGEVLQFCEQWMESKDGFSKARSRPRRMRSNCLARVPPLPVCTKAEGDRV